MMIGGEPVLIAGAGLGGLTAAVALGQMGVSVRVLEQAPRIAPIGYGIQLGPNVLQVLEPLGLAGSVLAQSLPINAIFMHDAYSGTEIIRIDCGDAMTKRFDYPYVVIHRGDLHGILLDACGKLDCVTIREGFNAVGYEQSGDGVIVRSDRGETATGCALVAADGVHSRFRSILHPQDEPQHSGFAAHRSLVSLDQLPAEFRNPEVALWGGSGFHIIHYPLVGDQFLNVVAVFRTSSYHSSDNAEDIYKEEVEKIYQKADPHVRLLLPHLDVSRRWPIVDRKPVRGWSDGRVLLIGDAAHGTLQSLAQGAGMAIEDAVMLANLMGKHDCDTSRVFPLFEKMRLHRTARVQLESRALWEMYHCGDINADVRNEVYQARTPTGYYDCLDWLWRAPSDLCQATREPSLITAKRRDADSRHTNDEVVGEPKKRSRGEEVLR
jgi:2-polyprenyl-6-methoxyphenol hydroxylase-like FAD-dependent oxidoreductase